MEKIITTQYPQYQILLKIKNLENLNKNIKRDIYKQIYIVYNNINSKVELLGVTSLREGATELHSLPIEAIEEYKKPWINLGELI
ncbi:MAG: hypothetical protein K0R54_757 [Clostridiaceae bacterium]|nr:hypothetical protein [Clostridiaceae bacterium]